MARPIMMIIDWFLWHQRTTRQIVKVIQMLMSVVKEAALGLQMCRVRAVKGQIMKVIRIHESKEVQAVFEYIKKFIIRMN